MDFWMWFVLWLALFVAVGELRSLYWRKRWCKWASRNQPSLTPSKWSEDVLKYYAHNPTRRQL